MRRTGQENRSTLVPTVGFVLAGFGVAAGFLTWSPAVAVGPVESLPAVVSAGIAFLAFAARRYGIADRRLDIVAGFGSGALAISAVFTLLQPATTDAASSSVGAGVWAGFVLGVLGLSVAYADWLELPTNAFLGRSRYAAAGLGIGITGLLVGFLFSATGVALVSETQPILQSGVSAITFSVGLGVVAFGFLIVTDRDASYIDLYGLARRDWLYVIGGIIGMFVILFGITIVTDFLEIPSAQHGLIEDARGQPHVLLFFIPLSWLVIGPGEELLSRNIIQKYLYEAFSRRGAVIVATVIFTVIHLPAYATGSPAAIFATLVRLFSISLVLGVVYERTRNVIVVALVHGTYNAIQFGLAYVAMTAGYI